MSEIKWFDEPIHYLNYYYQRYNETPFKVATRVYSYYEYWEFKSEEFYEYWERRRDTQPGHRYIFPDEIVIDLDNDDIRINKKNAKKIEKRLEKKGLTYRKFYSGNKGYHFHLFFPELKDYEGFHNKIMKQLIVYGFIFGCEHMCKHKDCLIKEYSVDTQLTGKHLIRCEYGLHEKTGRVKRLLKDNLSEMENIIPINIKKKFEDISENVKVDFSNLNIVHRSPTFNAIISNYLSDGKKRACFFLASRLKLMGKTEEETLNVIMQWNNNIQKLQLTEQNIRNVVYNGYKEPKGLYTGDTYGRQILNEAGIEE